MLECVRSSIGWFCSSRLGICRAVLVVGGSCPMAWKAIFAASKYAPRESTIVPSKSKRMPLTFSLVAFILCVPVYVLCLSTVFHKLFALSFENVFCKHVGVAILRCSCEIEVSLLSTQLADSSKNNKNQSKMNSTNDAV